MFGQNPRWVKHLRLFGESGTVKIVTNTSPKLSDKGVQCMMVGYAENHDGDVYRMWNPVTRWVHVTRDVIWLRQMMFQKRVEEDYGRMPEEIETAILELQGREEPEEIGEVQDELTEKGMSTDEDQGLIEEGEPEEEEFVPPPVAEEQPQWVRATTRHGRVSRLPERYRQELNAAAIVSLGRASLATKNYYEMLHEEEDDEDEDEHEESKTELACVGAGLVGGFENTAELHAMTYKEAMKTADKTQWDLAVKEEHERMISMNVWKAVPKDEVPKDAKIITTTWAMKKKANGRFRARVNARGFMQVDGEHYNSDNISSPVTNEATIRVVLVLSVIFRWTNELIDVKGAFLCGNFQEEKPIYMKVPEGFEKYYQGNVLLLLL